MNFKEFFLREWITDSQKDMNFYISIVQEIKDLIIKKKYQDAEDLLEKTWNRLTNQLKPAQKEKEIKEIKYITSILNTLDLINRKTPEIRNVKTQSF